MAKRGGRKRKAVLRHKGGKIIQPRAANPKELAARMPHRASAVIYAEFKGGTYEVQRIVRTYVPDGELHNEKAETPLGRLRLVNAISEEQYLAGRQFAQDVSRYRKILECPSPSQSIAGFGEPSAGRAPEVDADQSIKMRQKYDAAFAAIGSRTSQAAIKHVIIQELELNPGLFCFLVMGLRNLVSHYGLTR